MTAKPPETQAPQGDGEGALTQPTAPAASGPDAPPLAVAKEAAAAASGAARPEPSEPAHAGLAASVAAGKGRSSETASTVNMKGSGPVKAAPAPAAGAAAAKPAPAGSPPLLELVGIGQDFPEPDGSTTEVLRDISFRVTKPETICLLGPSGCGKSTVLRMVSGMHDRYVPMPSRGVCRVLGEEVSGPHDKVLTVFQRPTLKAWLSVRDNILLPFKAPLWGEKVPESERGQRVDAMLRAVGLQDAAKLKPRQLSGGMQQRVSLAARLVLRPPILCMDEPFSALDPQTREEMQELCMRVWQISPCLALFVTHDVSEALRIADRIIVLSTRPATVLEELTVPAPKPRPANWLHSPEFRDLEQHIISRIREAASRPGGVVNVDV
ncbi:ABC transporter ATP-binding protein [Haliangium ochraceum]|uniref:ABC transporter related protein n=1 Tax=Haliangium ochraceum (strain DSM 14365 / JCM 11303 / SMP-2) TaxID=502025 RepID=D0LVL5_HALO1|nr:ABC transporter ATP-binding protein [Haliangium ochraceum]ACY17576.1 ABC transporter related protein [Haliangium ochraceum DSM 14365]